MCSLFVSVNTQSFETPPVLPADSRTMDQHQKISKLYGVLESIEVRSCRRDAYAAALQRGSLKNRSP